VNLTADGHGDPAELSNSLRVGQFRVLLRSDNGGSRIMEARPDAVPGFRGSRSYLKLRALGRIVRNYTNGPQRLLPGKIAKFRGETRPEPAIQVDLPVDITYPEIDLGAHLDPLAAISRTPELAEASAFFAHSPSATRSLVSAVAQGMIY
jgi:hypothetical protein